MMHFLKRLFLPALLISTLMTQPAAQAAPATKYKTNLPPSVELAYAIKAKQKGIPVDGDAVMRWTAVSGKFAATNVARAMLIGKILDARSEGEIDGYGLAPAVFTEKRVRREATVTTFDRAAGTIRFSGSPHTYPIKGGEQDRNSVIWQLVAVARIAPGRIKPGTSWSFFVAGQRDAEQWTFKVVKQEKLRTPLGDLNTLHITKVPPPDSKEQHLDIWLAPSLEWYPARLRFSDDNGDYIEQTLLQVSRKDS
jgi:hypothetical protein